MPPKEKKTERLNLYFKPATVEKIRHLSDVTGFSLSDVIAEAVNRWYRFEKDGQVLQVRKASRPETSEESRDVPDHPGV